MQRFWNFVKENATASPSALRLKYHGRTVDDIDIPLAITQIECRQKYAKKFAQTLADNPQFLFPCVLAAEQATGDLLAAYHAALAKSGRAVDLTAGLGIDAIHLASKETEVVAIEMDKERAEALEYNTRSLSNISVALADCREYLEKLSDSPFDVAFIDPARRADDGSRVYALADCKPNVVEMYPLLRRHCRQLIVKASPMLDIAQICKEVPGIYQVIALGTTTECKEIVAIADMRHTNDKPIEIKAVTLTANGEVEFCFTAEEEAGAECEIGQAAPGQYLYEPYPSVMKAGPFFLLAQRFGLKKLHSNTHLYVSDALVPSFPGTVLKIKEVYTYESKHIKRLKGTYPVISVTTRNFDISADALRKKLGVKDGLPLRLFAVTSKGGKQLIIAE